LGSVKNVFAAWRVDGGMGWDRDVVRLLEGESTCAGCCCCEAGGVERDESRECGDGLGFVGAAVIALAAAAADARVNLWRGILLPQPLSQ
jgi:hypothetical protein